MSGAARDWLLGVSLGLLALAALFLHEMHGEVQRLQDRRTDTMSQTLMSDVERLRSEKAQVKQQARRPHAKRVQSSKD